MPRKKDGNDIITQVFPDRVNNLTRPCQQFDTTVSIT